MIFTICLLIVLVLSIAFVSLSAQSGKEMEKRKARERDEAIEAHLRIVRSKYAGSDPSGYRARHHADFTGERPLSPSQLAEIKESILR